MPGFKKRRIQASEEDSEGESMVTAKKAKTTKATKPAAAKAGSKATDGEGNAYWEIGNNRRIGASKFKNATLVNIREYYNAADGEARPGKRGISLSLEQYKSFLKIIPQLNEELRSQGHDVGDVASAVSIPTAVKKAPAAGPAPAAASSSKKGKKPKKSNIEETSDEEEEEEEEEEDDEDSDSS